MLLKPLGKGNSLVVVVVLNTVAESLVVFLLDEQIVDGVVDSTLVLGLHVKQERLDKRMLSDFSNMRTTRLVSMRGVRTCNRSVIKEGCSCR